MSVSPPPFHAAPFVTLSPEMAARVDRAREAAMHEPLPNAMVFSLLCTLATALVLAHRVSHPGLEIWMAARMVLGSVRYACSARFLLQRGTGRTGASLAAYRILTTLDGLSWSALLWGLTPLDHLEVAIVTISVTIGVAALGTFILHVDWPSLAGFISAMLLPNMVYVTLRGDDLAWYCAAALAVAWGILLSEGRRSSRRVKELLALRYLSEQMAQTREEALQHAKALSEARSRFVATMSHEMRTPLHGILGLTRQLRLSEADVRRQRQLELIRGSGEHLVNVINDILDYSSIEAGKLPIHPQVFNLHALLQEMVETTRVSAQDKGLALQVACEVPPEADVMGDPVRLRQVLHNLLGNAVKFTPSGFVRLTARLEAAAGVLSVAVTDTGVGIPPADVPRIFEAFHQAEGTYQRRFGGTGLGLTISRDLCVALGGELRCESELGRGSVFRFTLPLPVVQGAAPSVNASGEATATMPMSSPLAPGWGATTPRVLLVEDNHVNAMIAEAELQALGVDVLTVDNGADAVARMASGPVVDLVLMDCEMPGMDGFETTRRIRALEVARQRAPVPIIALTANGQGVYADRCRVAGMDDHLAKPFAPADLARLLRRHLRMSSPPAAPSASSAPTACVR